MFGYCSLVYNLMSFSIEMFLLIAIQLLGLVVLLSQVVEKAIWQKRCVILRLKMVEMLQEFMQWMTIS